MRSPNQRTAILPFGPDPRGSPAYQAIVEDLLQPVVLGRHVRLSPSEHQLMDDAADDASVVHSPFGSRIVPQKRRDLREQLIRQSEMVYQLS